MRKKLERFGAWFSTPKTTAWVNGICALLFFGSGCRMLPYQHNHFLAGMFFFNAMIFGASFGLNLARHWELEIRKSMQKIIDNQDEFIDELISEVKFLNDKDAS
jgi:hypothetical protein